MIRKVFVYLLPILLAATLLIVPFANVAELMSGSQSGKSFYFAFAVITLIIAAIISNLIGMNYILRIKPLDVVIGLYFCYSVMHPWLFGYSVPSIIWVEAISLALFYLIVRQVSEKYLIILLIGVSLAGMAQAIYGNLQLWGYYPSNHGIFRMSGSFFNPGPFAGYLCAVLLVAITFYLHSSDVRLSENLIVRKFESLSVRAFERLETSIAQTKTLIRQLTDQTFKLFFSNAKPSNSEASNIQTAQPSNSEANISNSIASNILKGIALITIIAIVLVLPASRSRAAWLGVLAGCLFVFQTIIRHKTDLTSEASSIQTYFFKLLIPFKQLNLLQKRGLLAVGILLSVLSLVGMYKFKQGSADGRLLIWKVSAGMIKDKPIFGHGTDKFAASYMNYQAAYFKPNPEVPEAMQADNVTYAYNEFLKLTVENGLIGLLLGLGVIGCLFFGKSEKRKEGRRQKLEGRKQILEASLPEREAVEGRRQKLKNPIVLAARGGLLSILVFAMFSYPSDILPIRMLFVLFMAIVATHQTPMRLVQLPAKKAAFTGKAVWYSALAIVLITVCPASQYLARQYQAYKSWKDATDVYNVGSYPECLEDFELAYPHLKTNGEFLVEYGKALEMAEKHENSVALLNEAKTHLNNTILYTCLGNNYKALGRNAEAEQAYLHAWNMAPARFYTLYLLAKLYNETGQKEKATAIAKIVMEKEVKIESTAVEEIKEEMRKVIEKQDNTQDMFNQKGKGRKHNHQVAAASCPAPFLKKKVR